MADSELPANVRALIAAADKAPVSADRIAIRAKVLATIGGAGAGGGASGSGAAKIVMGAIAVVVVGGVYLAVHGRAATVPSPSVGVSASVSVSVCRLRLRLRLRGLNQPRAATTNFR